ncbi:glutathione S-transferase family protein [Dyella sp.]|jgi:glutathione S-transferase|uniref:glutathione S-transferase family protein n=1 Tax=Dyella sp. TaxID=1869338 RepID=UPI002D79EB79|nr:glutathione S-transferase family protein [Dyella sp.]HET6431783.1 glutathione S-transferase family protein [Dyella sp.]
MSEPVSVIGSPISPYVRKVLAMLELKGVPYRLDPIAPFVGNAQFTGLSPLRRIPVLIDGALVLNDSSVICQYLEERHPEPSLYPADVADRARARWLEEYADTHLGDVLIWRLFFQLGARRFLFREEADEAMVRTAREQEIPAALDYLEAQLPPTEFAFGALSIADLTLASFFRTAAFVKYTIDATRWPRMAALVAAVMALPAMQKLAALEDHIVRLPLAEQRPALAAMGVALTATTLGDGQPQRGFR